MIHPQPQASVIDDASDISDALQDLGYHVVVIDPRALLKNRSEVKCLRQGQFSFGWITEPIRGRRIHPDKYGAGCSEIVAMMYAAEESSTPCVLYGAFGAFWNQPDVYGMSTREAIVKRFHRLCHFRIKIDPDIVVPSSACMITLSFNLPIKNHSCKCNMNERVMDWLTEHQHRIEDRKQPEPYHCRFFGVFSSTGYKRGISSHERSTTQRTVLLSQHINSTGNTRR